MIPTYYPAKEEWADALIERPYGTIYQQQESVLLRRSTLRNRRPSAYESESERSSFSRARLTSKTPA